MFLIRELKPEENHFLKEILHLALFVPEDEAPFPYTILENPEITKYIKNWRRSPNDLALVTVVDENLVGAIWGRTWKPPNMGYGFIDEHIPEISMAVKTDFRNKGIGTKLLKAISELYKKKGIEAISLSVDKGNPAKMLYERTGFKYKKEEGTTITMKKIIP